MAAKHKSFWTGSANVSSLSDHPEVEEREGAIVRGIAAMLAEPVDTLEERLAALPEITEGEKPADMVKLVWEEALAPSLYRQAIQEASPAHSAGVRTPQQSQGAESIYGWEEDMAEAAPDGATQAPLFHLPHSFWAPAKITKADERDFWVLPGKVDPDIFCRVSRIQRVLNFRVFRLWGYFMPYAPLWVYDKMEQLVDDWVVKDICAKEKALATS
ncbi:hypothetical protein XELAEV_18003270mg [Xenopus laevis]|nr:hypothetical protein XELAEV_18003270mg [Xenopus laevis]